MTAEHCRELGAFLLAGTPRHVMLLGEPASRHAAHLVAAVKSDASLQTCITILSTVRSRGATTVADPAGPTPRDVRALLSVYDDIDNLDECLGEASRQFAESLIVEHLWCDRHGKLRDSPRLRPERFFAFGFRRLRFAASTFAPASCYVYSLRDYKPVPDWLNARYWAHPERFDLDPE